MDKDPRHVSFVYELKTYTPGQLIASGEIVSKLVNLQSSFMPLWIGDHYVGQIRGLELSRFIQLIAERINFRNFVRSAK